MPAAQTVTIAGLAETVRSIRGLMRYEVQQKIAAAIKTVADPIVETARGNIVAQGAIRSGSLYDSMIAVAKVNPRKGTASVILGPKKQRVTASGKSGAATYKVGNVWAMPAKYAHLVEFGTRAHSYRMRTRRGIQTFLAPATRAKPFLGPAFALASGSALSDIGAAVGRIVEAQARAENKAMAKQAKADRAAYRAELAAGG